MQDHSRRLSEPLQWGRREKTIASVLLAVVAAAVIALGAYALTSGGSTPRDCVSVTFASTLGGAELHGCGAQARNICASGSFPRIAQELKDACERAGFPYRAPAPRAR